MPIVQSNPSEQPDALRVCYRGVMTIEQAQEKIGARARVVEVRDAQCLGEGPYSGELVPATEVIYEIVASDPDTQATPDALFALADAANDLDDLT